MSGTGWEIQPAGWLLLLFLGILLIYFVIRWLQYPSKQSPGTI
jgi:hypothetical protein